MGALFQALSQDRELADVASFAVQLAGFVLAFLLGLCVAPKRLSVGSIAVLCGLVISAVMGHWIVSMDGQGSIFAMILYPVLAYALASIGRTIRWSRCWDRTSPRS